ncbi:MAG: hypothetical protein JWN44_1735 [Myxococcales bacterium]|nr:hypothetical protein [Myxococcales bacterium]
MRALALSSVLALVACDAPPTCLSTVTTTDAAMWGRRANEWVAQFVVSCDGRRGLRLDGPGCVAATGLMPGLHRDAWVANYLNYDDPADPANRGALERQRYASLVLADQAAYPFEALVAAGALGDVAALDRARTFYLPSFVAHQLPSAAFGLPSTQRFDGTPLDAAGAFAQSLAIDAGADGLLGTADDVATFRWTGHSTLHTAVIGAAVADYVARTGDHSPADALAAALRFVMSRQRPDGAWAYALADVAAPDDALTTAVAAQFLGRAARAGIADATSAPAQSAAALWLRDHLAGASTTAVAAAVGVALDQGDLGTARALGDRLLAAQVGRCTDRHATGGLLDGTFESSWSPVYAVPSLLRLAAESGDLRYRDAADRLIAWIVDKLQMADSSGDRAFVQDLAGAAAAVEGGSWWGLMPEVYETDRSGDTRAGRIVRWVTAGQSDGQRPSSWLEQETGADLERTLIDHVRHDAYWASISYSYGWDGSGDVALPVDLGHVTAGINPLATADAAVALLAYALLR